MKNTSSKSPCGTAVLASFLSLWLVLSCKGVTSSSSMFGVMPKPITTRISMYNNNDNEIAFGYQTHKSIFDLRGGASKRKSRTGSLTGSLAKTVTGKKKVGAKKASTTSKSAKETVLELYKNIPLLTRIIITSVGVVTFLGVILGEERAQTILALDPMRVFLGMEFWRPLTAASFLGKPSLNWILKPYFLYMYGSQLEGAYGRAQFLIFLTSQIIMLTLMSSLLGIPFFSEALITAQLHVLSRAKPKDKVKWYMVTIPYWMLPYANMLSDTLQAQSLAPAIPHFMGILSGHFYHFHRFIWPKTGGEDWLQAPDFLVEYMDPDAASRNKAKDSVNKALKNRKRKGKMLGSV